MVSASLRTNGPHSSGASFLEQVRLNYRSTINHIIINYITISLVDKHGKKELKIDFC